MSINYIDRENDEEIIDIVRSIMDNRTGKAETANEHILLKLMQIRGTPMTSFEFDQERVDFHYNSWITDNEQGGEMKTEYFSPKTPTILIPALRQYQHNDCSGLLAGFDYEDTVVIVCGLQNKISGLEKQLADNSEQEG